MRSALNCAARALLGKPAVLPETILSIHGRTAAAGAWIVHVTRVLGAWRK
jgi:hypothetical protein